MSITILFYTPLKERKKGGVWNPPKSGNFPLLQ